MEPNLERLIRLQEICQAIDGLSRQLSAMPSRMQDLDQALARHRADVARTKDDLAGLQKDRRKLEGDLQAAEAKISKYQGQLMEVKTNKEYTAMLHEIDRAKSDLGEIETKILQGMEAADALQAGVREKDAALAEEQTRVTAGLATLQAEQADLQSRKGDLEGRRQALEAELPGDLVSEFSKIIRARGGEAVVRVIAGLCQGCHVRIQPRIIQQVRRNEEIFRCDYCRRFLYYIEEKRAEPDSPPGA